jgi:hypothetical protein
MVDCCKFTAEKVFIIIIIIAVVVLLAGATYAEIIQWRKVGNFAPLNTVTDLFEKQRQTIFYGCFGSQNDVKWRGRFIIAVICAIIISYALTIFYGQERPITLGMFFLILMTVFFIQYGYDQLKTAHLYDGMCHKFKSDSDILIN